MSGYGTSWIQILDAPAGAICQRCGAEKLFHLPRRLSLVVEDARRFQEQHTACLEPAPMLTVRCENCWNSPRPGIDLCTACAHQSAGAAAAGGEGIGERRRRWAGAGGRVMDKRREAELLRRLGPTENWVLPADEIERVARTATCRHGKLPVTACNDCFVSALLRRQVTMLAERLGCSPEDAQSVSDSLCNEFLEEPRARP